MAMYINDSGELDSPHTVCFFTEFFLFVFLNNGGLNMPFSLTAFLLYVDRSLQVRMSAEGQPNARVSWICRRDNSE